VAAVSKNLLFLLQAAAATIERRRLASNDTFLACVGVTSPELEIYYFDPDGLITSVPITESAWSTVSYVIDVHWSLNYLLVLTAINGTYDSQLRIYKVSPDEAVQCTVTGGTLTGILAVNARLAPDAKTCVVSVGATIIRTPPTSFGYGFADVPQFSVCGGDIFTPTYTYEDPEDPEKEIKIVAWYWTDFAGDKYYTIGHKGFYRSNDTTFVLTSSAPDPYWYEEYPTPETGGELPYYSNSASPPDTGCGNYGLTFTSNTQFTYGGAGDGPSDPRIYGLRTATINPSTGKICYAVTASTAQDSNAPLELIYPGGWYVPSSSTPKVIAPISLSAEPTGAVYNISFAPEFVAMSIGTGWDVIVDIYNNGTKLSAIPALESLSLVFGASRFWAATFSPDAGLLAVPHSGGCALFLRDGTSFSEVTAELPEDWTETNKTFAVFSGQQS
jgi:hypothetical protein